MKIFVTGAAGMVGSAIKEVFQSEADYTDIDDFDVRVSRRCLPGEYSCILHLAAETDLEICEGNLKHAYEINLGGTVNMVELAEWAQIPLVYISTAGVFNGKKHRYQETDKPDPLNVYGASKLSGEHIVGVCSRYYIIRTGWMMGGGPAIDKKFVNKVFKKTQRGEQTIYALTDHYGSPTYTLDFAKTIRNIIKRRPPYGIYHCGGEGRASRYDVAKEMLACLGLTDKVKLVPVTGDALKDEFPCLRPKGEVLDNTKLKRTGLSCMRDWRVSLREYLDGWPRP